MKATEYRGCRILQDYDDALMPYAQVEVAIGRGPWRVIGKTAARALDGAKLLVDGYLAKQAADAD